MLAGASVPGQRCANAAGGPILCHRSQWTSSRTRSDRSTAHPIAQVKHLVALDHHVGILQQVLCMDQPESALAPEHDGYDVHAHLVDQAHGKHLATDVTSGGLDDAVTRQLLRFRHRCRDAVDEVKRRSGCQPSGCGRCVTTTTSSIRLGGFPSQPSVRSKTSPPASVAPISSQYGRCSRRTPATPSPRRSRPTNVTVGQPVEHQSGLVILVRDEAVHRHRGVHDHLAHGALLWFGCPTFECRGLSLL